MRVEGDPTGVHTLQGVHPETAHRELYEIVTSMMSRFIGRSGLEDAIKGALKDMCRFGGATNGLLYLPPEASSTFGERHEWRQEKVGLQTRLTMLPHEVLNDWLSLLPRHRIIHIENIQSGPAQTTGHHEELRAAGIREMLILPLEWGANRAGFIALAITSEGSAWSAEQVNGLKALTHALAQALERKHSEQIMRDVDKVRALVLDSVSELVTLMDLDMKILWGNRAAAESLGMTPQQLIGRHCYELWNERTELCVGCPVHASLGAGEPRSGEVITPDGRMWHLNGYPVRNSAGEIVAVAEVTTDITELKRTAVELRKSEEKFRTLVEHSLQGVAVVQDYRLVFVNAALAELTGFTIKELISLRPSEVKALVHPDDQDMVWGRFRERLEGKPVDARYSFRTICKDFPCVAKGNQCTCCMRGRIGGRTDYSHVAVTGIDTRRCGIGHIL